MACPGPSRGIYLTYLIQALILLSVAFSFMAGEYFLGFSAGIALLLTMIPFFVTRNMRLCLPWDADLILAGHTHGGQFLFPVIDQLNDRGIIELAGMFAADGTPTYISRGVCGSGLAGVDLRFNCQPEIVLINPTEEQLQAVNGSA